MCLISVITQRSKTDFGRFVGESRVRERGLGVILCTYIPILRRRYVEGTSLEELLCVVYVILDEISQKSEGTHLMSAGSILNPCRGLGGRPRMSSD